MTSSEQKENLQKEISFSDIFNFLKTTWQKTLICSAISLIVTLLVIAIAFFWLPKSEQLTLKVFLNLQNNSRYVAYPSGKIFNAEDILSPAVLRTVYNDNKLKGKIDFDDFCALFSLSGESLEKAKLEAAYREKLANKKNTVLELTSLENEYKENLQKLETNCVQLAMTPTIKISRSDAVRILNQVPKAWFNIYSREEAKRFPDIVTVNQIQMFRSNINTDGWLITLDKCRLACKSLQTACKEMDELLSGKKVTLVSGESLNDLEERLYTLLNHRISPLMLIVQDTPSLLNPLDQLFIQGKIMDLEKEIKAETEKFTGTVAAIKILYPGDNAVNAKNAAAPGDAKVQQSLSLDGNLFTSLTSLITDSQSLQYRATYAEKALKHKIKIADYSAERDYYMTLLGLKKRQLEIAKMPVDQFGKICNTMFNELLLLSAKVNSFRDLIFRDYILPGSFYSTTGEVKNFSSFAVPFKRIACGLIVLVILLNVLVVVKNFYVAWSKGLLENN